LFILPLQGPDSAAEADHVGSHQPVPVRENPPSEKRDAISGAVDARLARMQQKPKLVKA
jgi:hypothetical protein